MKHFMEDTIERADALALATSVCRRDALELFALAETNPQLLAEWLDELTRCRDGARNEADRLTAAVDYLRIARRVRFGETALRSRSRHVAAMAACRKSVLRHMPVSGTNVALVDLQIWADRPRIGQRR
jgi:hypothetical protein